MTKKDDLSAVREAMKPPRKKGWISRRVDAFASLWRRWSRWVLRKLLLVGFISVVVSALLVILFRFANPYVTYYYVAERARLGEVQRDWTPIEEFSPHMPLSVVAAEDAMFCNHFGFNVDAIKAALDDDKRLRGGSTISQQVAKNVFLWQGRTWVRKGLEAWFTLLIELIWPKQRIVEVYLNVAEFDEGIFGAASTGRHYFGVEPGELTPLQAARLAAVLPSPKKRSASRPTSFIKKQTRKIISGAETINQDGRADCFQ